MPSTFTMYARRQLLKAMFTPDDFIPWTGWRWR